MITVLEAGAFTTIQDLGRPGLAHLGVSAAGAADSFSLRLGNRLVGNPDGAAGLELTLVGGAYRFESPALVAVTGSDFGAAVESSSGAVRTQPPWSVFGAGAGDVLRLGATQRGARAYLCVAGGIASPLVLGSRSTHVATGLGGMDGGPVRAGQQLAIGTAPSSGPRRLRADIDEVASRIFRRSLRFTPGPQADWFHVDAASAFRDADWEVSESADRAGLRLLGPGVDPPDAGRMLTEGVCAGSVQIPGDGRPIVLFVDQQTTGGYAKLATVIAADLPSVGQLRPRHRIRFEEVGWNAAHLELVEQERFLDAALDPA